jgi:hypothetical protein
MGFQDLKTLSREYSLSIFTFRKFVKLGLPHYRVGRKILVDPEEFENWFEKFKVISTLQCKSLDGLIEDAMAKLE